MNLRLGLSAVFLKLGAGFFLAGTVGLLRFPDTYARLHALTKADNLGLGLILIDVRLAVGSGRRTGQHGGCHPPHFRAGCAEYP